MMTKTEKAIQNVCAILPEVRKGFSNVEEALSESFKQFKEMTSWLKSRNARRFFTSRNP